MTGFDPVDFLGDAVAIPSHEDVDEMRSFLCETLREHDVEPTVDDAGNVTATRVGDPDGPHLVLNTHIDTVAPHVPPSRDGDTLSGRGSCDAKGPLAAILAALFDCDPEAGRVTLVVTPDEEIYSTGAAALVPELDLDPERGDAVIVGEPTGLDVCTAAKGRFEGRLKIRGESAHAAEPESGTNAISITACAIEALPGFDNRPEGLDPHPDLGAPTLTPTVIDGGDSTNQVAGACEVVLDRRSVPPETADEYVTGLDSYLRERLGSGVSFELTDRKTPFLEAFETDADSDVVRAFEDLDCAARPFTAATEASYFAQRAPTVVFGPGVLADDEGPVAHAEREYVRLPEVERAAETLGNVVEKCLRESHS